MRETTPIIYYKKAFENMRRCLREARIKGHPHKDFITQLKNLNTGNNESVMCIEQAIIWCINNHVLTWSSGTWRLNRLGYKLLLGRYLKKDEISKKLSEQLIKKMYSAHCLPKSKRQKKTTAKRKKNIKSEEIYKIEEHINKKKNKWGDALIVWLKSSMITGLRPNEWQTVELFKQDGKIILKTENFKHNKQRSYAPYREIDISSFTQEMIEWVKIQISITKKMKEAGMSSSHYRGCVDLLFNINKHIWPKRVYNITLYTGRHQFSSNTKASNTCSEKERAAMMGHKTTKTSRERYGKRRSGNHGIIPEINNKEVLKNINDPKIKSFTPENKNVLDK